MSDNAILDFCLERLQASDWLGLSTLYFDNAYTINVFASRGYVAYSSSKKCFFAMGCLDSTDSTLVDNTYAVLEHHILGQQQNVTVIGDDHLQHIDVAQYSRYQFYNDAQTVMPWAHIPTRATIMGLEKDPVTGLYPNTDTVGMIPSNPNQDPNTTERIISAIGFYPQEEGAQQKSDPNMWYYSGAIIDNWKRFYVNQEKFRKMLNDAFGVSDAI
jgi:hypothetical protein